VTAVAIVIQGDIIVSKWIGRDECIKVTETAGITAGTVLTNAVKCDINPCLARVDIKVSAVTVVGSVTAVVEQLILGTWMSVKTLAITTTGNKVIAINETQDYAILPLSGPLRVSVISTNAGDKLTVDNIVVHVIR
jgi:hypothetical protein